MRSRDTTFLLLLVFLPKKMNVNAPCWGSQEIKLDYGQEELANVQMCKCANAVCSLFL